MRWFLFRVYGRRVFLAYGCVSMLSVAVLAALYLTSGYAIMGYVSDQLTRIPWDITVLQRGETQRFPELQRKYRELRDVRDVQALGFLRIRNMSPMRLEIDARVSAVRWVAFVSASKPELLPPGLRRASQETPYQIALVAARRRRPDTVGTPVPGGGSTVRLAVVGESHDDSESDDHHRAGTDMPVGVGRTVFEGASDRPPVQIERQEFNKWILRDVGSLSYLPEEAVLISIPLPEFQALAGTMSQLFLSSEGIHGGEAPPPYVPEISHLIALNRAAWVSPWELDTSLQRIRPVVREVFAAAQWLTPFSYVASDLQTMLARMINISRLVGIVTLLIAVPLLWLGWVLAKTLAGLLVLNERRLIGLALIRGIPMNEIGRAILTSLILAGIAGGVAGLLLGAVLPVLGYSMAGRPIPPTGVLLRGLAYFGGFVGLGVLLALFAGWSILRFVRGLTPREASARVADAESETLASPVSWYYVAGVLIALGLGTYKIGSWMAGYSLVTRALGAGMSASLLPFVFLAESLLNFVAVPLFLFGIAGLLLWRVTWTQKTLSALTAPVVGQLHWFVGQHMALGRRRIVNMLFVSGLAMALTLLPQVAADTFYGRVLRGVRASIGADLHVEFDMEDLATSNEGVAPIAELQREYDRPLAAIRDSLQQDPRIANVVGLRQYIVPGVYIPGQSGLMLAVIDAPSEYLNTLYHEEGLGLTRPFSQIIDSLDAGAVAVSQGLINLRSVPLHRDIAVGYRPDDTPISVRFDDILTFLPGQPVTGVAQREGYAAEEVDYLNFLLASDARIVAAAQHVAHSNLGALPVVPSRAVFVVRTKSGEADESLANSLVARLPFRPQQVRWQELDRQRVSKDMFISLALENMKVFMIGGLVLALASVMAIGLANFVAERRTFALLRLRGVPLPLLLRLSLSMFLIPVVAGILMGIALGALSGYGISQAVWDLPRVYGVAGFLSNQLVLSTTAWGVVTAFSGALTVVALALGLWPFRRTAREAIKES